MKEQLPTLSGILVAAAGTYVPQAPIRRTGHSGADHSLTAWRVAMRRPSGATRKTSSGRLKSLDVGIRHRLSGETRSFSPPLPRLANRQRLRPRARLRPRRVGSSPQGLAAGPTAIRRLSPSKGSRSFVWIARPENCFGNAPPESPYRMKATIACMAALLPTLRLLMANMYTPHSDRAGSTATTLTVS